MPNVMAALPNIGGALCSTGRHLYMGGAVVQRIEHWTLQSIGHGFNNLLEATLRNNLGQVVHTYVPVTKQYNLVPTGQRAVMLCSCGGNRRPGGK